MIKPQAKFLLDADPLIGLFNDGDSWHERCADFFGKFDFEFVTTETVISEVDLKVSNILTIDRNDFLKLRWDGTKHFNVLLPDSRYLHEWYLT
ncbi:MAG: hypothetical protein KGS72_15940 [Cyanobacteria bacterium REEB67]|nr:hypothetical protein [Cyanobacteria bacterium REEB67]